MRVDPPQTRHAHPSAKFVQHAHPGHLGLAAQTGELSPVALLRQQLDQQVHRMHRGQQAQQMNPIKLCRAVISVPPTGASARPAFVEEVVGHKPIQEFEQRHRAGRRKVGIHAASLPLGL